LNPDAAIRKAKARERSFKLSDGGGLFLLVEPAGGRLWRYKYRFQGAERKLAIGKCPDIALQEARRLCQYLRGALQSARPKPLPSITEPSEIAGSLQGIND
jgi:hypothetical protein